MHGIFYLALGITQHLFYCILLVKAINKTHPGSRKRDPEAWLGEGDSKGLEEPGQAILLKISLENICRNSQLSLSSVYCLLVNEKLLSHMTNLHGINTAIERTSL